MITGHVIDTTNYRDYTSMRLDEMRQVRFDEQVLKLGKKLHIAGIPTVIFRDGERIQGALDKATLEKNWLR